MKTAIYIEDGVVQLVLTPETEFEKDAMRSFSGESILKAEMFRGAFYDCRGGWVRQKPQYGLNLLSGRDDPNDGDNSLILRMQTKMDLKAKPGPITFTPTEPT